MIAKTKNKKSQMAESIAEEVEAVKGPNKLKEELDTLTQEVPESVVLHNGTEVGIFKAKIRQMGIISEFLEMALAAMGVNSVSGAFTISLDDPKVFLGIFSSCYEDLVKVVSSLCELSEEEFMDLEVDDGIAVAGGVWALNKAFFMRRVAAALPKLLGSTAQALLEAADPEEPSK